MHDPVWLAHQMEQRALPAGSASPLGGRAAPFQAIARLSFSSMSARAQSAQAQSNPTRRAKANPPGISDLLANSRQRLSDPPVWEMRFQLAEVAIVADVVAGAVLVNVAVFLRLAGNLFDHPEALQD